MDALYRYGAPYGMGEAEIQDMNISAASISMQPSPSTPTAAAATPTSTAGAAQSPGFWASVKNIGGDLISQGVKVAPALIQQKLAEKMASLTGGGTKPKSKSKKKKPKATAASADMPSYIPPPPAKKGLPGWVIPAAIGGVVLLGTIFFMTRRKKG